MLLTIPLFASYSELLFNGNCVTCHHETQSISAPSIQEVQENYKQAFPNKKEFVAYMSQWVLKPTLSGSLMVDSVKNYGLMPELGYRKDVLEEIAEYIYEKDFSKQQ